MLGGLVGAQIMVMAMPKSRDLPIVVTVNDAQNPGLLIRVLRTIADKIAETGSRLDAFIRDISVPSMAEIRQALQSDGSVPLNLTNLRGVTADPQPASVLRYDSSPVGLVLQSLKDSQLFTVKNGSTYDLFMAVGGNPNTKVQLTSGAAASNHNLLSAVHPDTVAASPVLGDIIYANSTPAWTKLAGNTTTTKKFATQTGNGTISAAPAWFDLFGTVNTWGVAQTFNSSISVLGLIGAIAGIRINVFGVTSTPTTLGVNTVFAYVNLSSPGASTVKLWASPITGDICIIKDDKGDAGTNNITVDGNGKNIDGAATHVINVNSAAYTYVYNGSQWNIC